jgi:hypothetical protein
MLERTFNHDIRLSSADQQFAMQKWSLIAHVLINEDLIRLFSQHEKAATRFKKIVQWLGTSAVLLMLVALLSSVFTIWSSNQQNQITPNFISIVIELCSLVGILLALLASRYGPFRRRWMKHRFFTECLRRWHFCKVIKGDEIDSSIKNSTARKRYLEKRYLQFEAFVEEFRGTVGQKMDRFIESGDDPLNEIPLATLPVTPGVCRELLEVYYVLRLNHQLEYTVYKLSVEDRTFLRLSIDLLTRQTDYLAAATLFLAMGFSVVQLITSVAWMPAGGVSLAILGVAVRAWRDGFALNEEKERYQDIRHRLERLVARWNNAANDMERFKVAEDVESLAAEELRAFIRTHERAQFLF